MLRRKMKKIFCSMAAALCLVSAAIPAAAATVEFDVTYPGDTTSPRTWKDDAEQRFYVTGTYFEESCTLSCFSLGITDPYVISYNTSISNTNRASNAAYQSTAQAGHWFYLSTAASKSGVQVIGRYTP